MTQTALAFEPAVAWARTPPRFVGHEEWTAEVAGCRARAVRFVDSDPPRYLARVSSSGGGTVEDVGRFESPEEAQRAAVAHAREHGARLNGDAR